ncbi:MAG: hypothetical protein HYU64_07220 [Armatimonadetes bacterium]|nr:hypothetical protein [Armatimonadota bacterium]
MISCPVEPSISRFRAFTATVPASSLVKIQKETIKLFINAEDRTSQLESTIDDETGDLFFSFRPTTPLPLGKNSCRLVGTTTEGRLVEKRWSFVVNPKLDPYLRPFFLKVQKRPKDTLSHYNLGVAYERKYLLADAQEEYRQAARLSARNQKARMAYDRLYALWDHKTLSKEGVTVDVTLDEGLLKIGKLLLIRVLVSNKTGKEVAIDPTEAMLTDGLGGQEQTLGNLTMYPKTAFETGAISVDDYARLTYFLEKHHRPLLNPGSIFPGVTANGYLAFQIKKKEAKNLTLIIPKITVKPRKSLSFKFPFTRH